jgi:gamma-glutamyl:cysteine ligase YbdK (ATP-grasp superfamily)
MRDLNASTEPTLIDLGELQLVRNQARDKVDAAKDVVRAATQLRDAAIFPRGIERTQADLSRAVGKLDEATRTLNQAQTCVDHMAGRLGLNLGVPKR